MIFFISCEAFIRVDFSFFTRFSKTAIRSPFRHSPISLPSKPSAERSFPLTARSFKVQHSLFSSISLSHFNVCVVPADISRYFSLYRDLKFIRCLLSFICLKYPYKSYTKQGSSFSLYEPPCLVYEMNNNIEITSSVHPNSIIVLIQH